MKIDPDKYDEIVDYINSELLYGSTEEYLRSLERMEKKDLLVEITIFYKEVQRLQVMVNNLLG